MTSTRRSLLGAAGLAAAAAWTPRPLRAAGRPPAPTEITLMRFFGSCEARVGNSTDVGQASGECGIVTALVNRFNAEQAGRVVVKSNVAEWGPYYDQLNARLVAQDAPTVSVMHQSVLGDYVRRKLVLPLGAALAEVGVDVADFTEHARRGVSLEGEVYALPQDTWSWLWHVNLNLMGRAGLLLGDGKPVLPTSPQELLVQAERFKRATGKPYFAWAVANERAAHTRTFLTLVSQQGGQLFAADGRAIDISGTEARTALALMKQLYDQGHIKRNADYGSANRTWLNGEAGTVVVGTWTIDPFMAEAARPDSPLFKGYHVQPFPRLYARPSVYADGHAWVLLRQGAAEPNQRRAALQLLKFFHEHNLDWARTGHLPTRRSVAASAAFKALPFRDGLASITRDGQGMPGNVPVQRSVENLLGEEIGNFVVSGRPLEQVIASVHKRVNVALRKARR